MIRNKLVPQDYCQMIIQYISNYRIVTKSNIIEYCIKNTKVLDDGDYEKISKLVQNVLDSLCDAAFISKCGEKYKEVKNVKKFNGTIFDEVKPIRKFSKKEIDRLNEIDKNTNNLDYIIQGAIMLGKELNQEKFEKLFKNRKLGYLTLNEIIDIAMNGEGMNSGVGSYRLWEFAGAYYRYDEKDVPILIIDREFNCEYNNSELTIKEYDGEILFNDSTFERLIINKIAEKTKFIDVVKKAKPYQQKHRKTDTRLRINAGATYGPFNEIDSL